MNRRSLLLSPLFVAFLIASLVLPPRSAYALRAQSPVQSSSLETLEAGLEEGTPPVRLFSAQSSAITSVLLTQDGETPIAGTAGNQLYNWALPVGMNEWGGPEKAGRIIASALSPDGLQFALGTAGGTVALRDTFSGLVQWVHKAKQSDAHSDDILDIAFTPDGNQVISVSKDGTVRFWNVSDGALQGSYLFPKDAPVIEAEFLPDSSKLVTVDANGIVKVFGLPPGQERFQWVKTFGGVGKFTRAVFTPGGESLVLVAADHGFQVREIASTALKRSFKPEMSQSGHTTPVRSLAVGPDGIGLAAGYESGRVLLWDLSTGKVAATLNGRGEPVTQVVFSSDGRRIASGDAAGVIRLWDNPLFKGSAPSVSESKVPERKSGEEAGTGPAAVLVEDYLLQLLEGDEGEYQRVWLKEGPASEPDVRRLQAILSHNGNRPESAQIEGVIQAIRIHPGPVALIPLEILGQGLLDSEQDNTFYITREALTQADLTQMAQAILRKDPALLASPLRVDPDWKEPQQVAEPPAIKTPPRDWTVHRGEEVRLSVEAAGPGPLKYQWQRQTGGNGEFRDVPGAASKEYRIPSAQAVDDGAQFKATVSNTFGSVTSDPARLTVRKPAMNSPPSAGGKPKGKKKSGNQPLAPWVDDIPPGTAERNPLPAEPRARPVGEFFSSRASLQKRLAVIVQQAQGGETLLPNEIMHDGGQNRVAVDVTDSAPWTFQLLTVRAVRAGLDIMPLLPTSVWLGDSHPVPSRYVAEVVDQNLSPMETAEQYHPAVWNFSGDISQILSEIVSRRDQGDLSKEQAIALLFQIGAREQEVLEGRLVGGDARSSAERLRDLKNAHPDRAGEIEEAERLIREGALANLEWFGRYVRVRKTLMGTEGAAETISAGEFREAVQELLEHARQWPEISQFLQIELTVLPADPQAPIPRADWLARMREWGSLARKVTLEPAWSSLPAGVLQAVYYDAVRLALSDRITQILEPLRASPAMDLAFDALNELGSIQILIQTTEVEAGLTHHMRETARPVLSQKVFQEVRPQAAVGVLFISPDNTYRFIPGGAAIVRDITREVSFNPSALGAWAQPGDRVVLLCACWSSRGIPHPHQQSEFFMELPALARFLPSGTPVFLGTVTSDGTLRVYEPVTYEDNEQGVSSVHGLVLERLFRSQRFALDLRRAADISEGSKTREAWRQQVLRVLTQFAPPPSQGGILVAELNRYAPEVAQEALRDIQRRFQTTFEPWKELARLIPFRHDLKTKGDLNRESRLNNRFKEAQPMFKNEILPRVIDMGQEWIEAPAIAQGVLFREVPLPEEAPMRLKTERSPTEVDEEVQKLMDRAIREQGFSRPEVESFAGQWRQGEVVAGRLASKAPAARFKFSEFNGAFRLSKTATLREAEQFRLEQQRAEELERTQERKQTEDRVAGQIAGFEKISPLDAQGAAAALVGSRQFASTVPADFRPPLDRAVKVFSESVVGTHEQWVSQGLNRSDVTEVQKEDEAVGQLLPALEATPWGSRLQALRLNLRERFVAQVFSDLEALYARQLETGLKEGLVGLRDRLDQALGWVTSENQGRFPAEGAWWKLTALELQAETTRLSAAMTYQSGGDIRRLSGEILAHEQAASAEPRGVGFLENARVGLVRALAIKLLDERKRVFRLPDDEAVWKEMLILRPVLDEAAPFLLDSGVFQQEEEEIIREAGWQLKMTLENFARVRAIPEAEGSRTGTLKPSKELFLPLGKVLLLTHRYSGRTIRIAFTGEVTPLQRQLKSVKLSVRSPIGLIPVSGNEVSSGETVKRKNSLTQDWRHQIGPLRRRIQRHERPNPLSLKQGVDLEEMPILDGGGWFGTSSQLWFFGASDFAGILSNPRVQVAPPAPGERRNTADDIDIRDFYRDARVDVVRVTPDYSKVSLRIEDALNLFEDPQVVDPSTGLEEGRSYRIDPDETAAVVVRALADRAEPIGTRPEGNGLLTLNYSQVSMLAGGRPTPQALSKSANESVSDTWLGSFNHALERIFDSSSPSSDVSLLRERGIQRVQVPLNPRPDSGEWPLARVKKAIRTAVRRGLSLNPGAIRSEQAVISYKRNRVPQVETPIGQELAWAYGAVMRGEVPELKGEKDWRKALRAAGQNPEKVYRVQRAAVRPALNGEKRVYLDPVFDSQTGSVVSGTFLQKKTQLDYESIWNDPRVSSARWVVFIGRFLRSYPAPDRSYPTVFQFNAEGFSTPLSALGSSDGSPLIAVYVDPRDPYKRPQKALLLPSQEQIYPFPKQIRIYLDSDYLYKALIKMPTSIFWKEIPVRQAKEVVFENVPTFPYNSPYLASFALGKRFQTIHPFDPQNRPTLRVTAQPVSGKRGFKVTGAYSMETDTRVYPVDDGATNYAYTKSGRLQPVFHQSLDPVLLARLTGRLLRAGTPFSSDEMVNILSRYHNVAMSDWHLMLFDRVLEQARWAYSDDAPRLWNAVYPVLEEARSVHDQESLGLELRRQRVEQLLTDVGAALPQPPIQDPYTAGLEEGNGKVGWADFLAPEETVRKRAADQVVAMGLDEGFPILLEAFARVHFQDYFKQLTPALRAFGNGKNGQEEERVVKRLLQVLNSRAAGNRVQVRGAAMALKELGPELPRRGEVLVALSLLLSADSLREYFAGLPDVGRPESRQARVLEWGLFVFPAAALALAKLDTTGDNLDAALGHLESSAESSPEPWLREMVDARILPQLRESLLDFATMARARRRVVNTQDNWVLLIEKDLLDSTVTADPGLELTLLGIAMELKRRIGWTGERNNDLQIAVVSDENRQATQERYAGWKVIRVRRKPGSDREALPLSALPVIAAKAMAFGGKTFNVVVTPYLDLGRYTPEDVWQVLFDSSA